MAEGRVGVCSTFPQWNSVSRGCSPFLPQGGARRTQRATFHKRGRGESSVVIPLPRERVCLDTSLFKVTFDLLRGPPAEHTVPQHAPHSSKQLATLSCHHGHARIVFDRTKRKTHTGITFHNFNKPQWLHWCFLKLFLVYIKMCTWKEEQRRRAQCIWYTDFYDTYGRMFSTVSTVKHVKVTQFQCHWQSHVWTKKIKEMWWNINKIIYCFKFD